MPSIYFVSSSTSEPIILPRSKTRVISTRFNGRPHQRKFSRWAFQQYLQRAGSFRANAGLKDTLATSGGTHRVTLPSDKVRRLLKECRHLVRSGKMDLWIDFRRVRKKPLDQG
jgi:hypothetical protein